MTRGMLVTVLGRLHKANVSSYTSGGAFADVLASQYYAPYVEWARANHLAVGVGQNLFLPDQEISRQDMAVILKRYADFTGKRLAETRLIATFADETDIADYAKPSVALLYRAGILGGVGDNQINPRGSVTRAEAAALLRRFIESV
jgi:hypothetical protein